MEMLKRKRGRPPKSSLIPGQVESQPMKGETMSNEEVKSDVVFWSRAKICHIANFREEKRDGARILQREAPIKFFDHLYITSSPEEIAFIRNSSTFENGDVRECKSVEEAQRLTAQRDAVKYAKDEETAEFSESTIIDTAGKR